MSHLHDISTTYDALDDSVYDIFDLDAYCSSLSPSVPDSEPVPNTPAPNSRLKRYPKTRGHPRPSPAVISPPAFASTSIKPPVVPAQPDKGKGCQRSALTPASTCSVDPQSSTSTNSVDLTQNSTSALCGCLSVLMSGLHRDGN